MNSTLNLAGCIQRIKVYSLHLGFTQHSRGRITCTKLWFKEADIKFLQRGNVQDKESDLDIWGISSHFLNAVTLWINTGRWVGVVHMKSEGEKTNFSMAESKDRDRCWGILHICKEVIQSTISFVLSTLSSFFHSFIHLLINNKHLIRPSNMPSTTLKWKYHRKKDRFHVLLGVIYWYV